MVIFLDIDGVLNCTDDIMNKYESGKQISSSETSESCISSFEGLLDKIPDARIVISSTWRLRFRNGAFKPDYKNNSWSELLSEKIASRIIDHTGKTIGDDCRGDDIHKWITKHPTNKWAIIDDDSDILDHQKCRFIKINRKIGFTNKDINKTISILQGEVK